MLLSEVEHTYYADLTNEIADRIEAERGERTWAKYWGARMERHHEEELAAS